MSIKVFVSTANGVPEVENVTGISDANGRFTVWDAVRDALAYSPKGDVSMHWDEFGKAVPQVKGKVTLIQRR